MDRRTNIKEGRMADRVLRWINRPDFNTHSCALKPKDFSDTKRLGDDGKPAEEICNTHLIDYCKPLTNHHELFSGQIAQRRFR